MAQRLGRVFLLWIDAARAEEAVGIVLRGCGGITVVIRIGADALHQHGARDLGLVHQGGEVVRTMRRIQIPAAWQPRWVQGIALLVGRDDVRVCIDDSHDAILAAHCDNDAPEKSNGCVVRERRKELERAFTRHLRA